MKEITNWKQRLQSAANKTVASMLDYSKLVYDFCESTEEADGLLAEWLNLSSSAISQLKTIGSNYANLLTHVDNLPCSSRGLYELAKLPNYYMEELLEDEKVTSGSTIEDITNLKDDPVLVAVKKKYANSEDFLEISRQLVEIKETAESSEEVEERLNSWIDDNVKPLQKPKKEKKAEQASPEEPEIEQKEEIKDSYTHGEADFKDLLLILGVDIEASKIDEWVLDALACKTAILAEKRAIAKLRAGE